MTCVVISKVPRTDFTVPQDNAKQHNTDPFIDSGPETVHCHLLVERGCGCAAHCMCRGWQLWRPHHRVTFVCPGKTGRTRSLLIVSTHRASCWTTVSGELTRLVQVSINSCSLSSFCVYSSLAFFLLHTISFNKEILKRGNEALAANKLANGQLANLLDELSC